MATMTEVSEKLSRSLLSQVCGSWGVPLDDMHIHLQVARSYWETEAAMRGLHRAISKMKWPQCVNEDSEDKGRDRQKRPRSASEKNGGPSKTMRFD